MLSFSSNRDGAQLEDAYRRYFPVIREKTRRMLADAHEAEDVAQEAFVRLWRSRMLGRPAHEVVAWVYRTSTRLGIDALRKHRRRPSPLVTQTDAALETRTAARQEVARMAAQLTGPELELLIMERLDRMTQDEMARVLGVSTRTIRRRSEALEQRLHHLRQEEQP